MKLGDFLHAVTYSEECAECSSQTQQVLFGSQVLAWLGKDFYLSTDEQMSPLKTQ